MLVFKNRNLRTFVFAGVPQVFGPNAAGGCHLLGAGCKRVKTRNALPLWFVEGAARDLFCLGEKLNSCCQ